MVITYPAKSAEGQAAPLWGRETNSDERNSDDVVMITQGKVLKPTATPNGMPPPSGTRLPSVCQIQGWQGHLQLQDQNVVDRGSVNSAGMHWPCIVETGRCCVPLGDSGSKAGVI